MLQIATYYKKLLKRIRDYFWGPCDCPPCQINRMMKRWLAEFMNEQKG